MIKYNFKNFAAIKFCLVIAIFLLTINTATAEIIDSIDVTTDTNGDVKALIKFVVPIQKVRYFPTGKSRFLDVYFNILDTVSPDQWQNFESKHSPPSDFISSFTVSTRDLKLGPKIHIDFDRDVEYEVKSGKTGRSILLILKKASSPVTQTAQISGAIIPSRIGVKEGYPPFPQIILPERKQKDVSPQDAQKSLKEVIQDANDKAALLMAKGEESLLANEMLSAIVSFNNVLNLPANKYTEDAQLWIGIARDKSGQTPQAIAEFETYLKLYPNTINSSWVKAKLASIQQTQKMTPIAINAPLPVNERPKVNLIPTAYHTDVFGSLSMYYYTGASQSTTVSTVGGIQTSSSLTSQDQAALFSSVLASMHTFNNEFDDRVVVQDSYAKNFLTSGHDRNRLSAAYAEVKNRISDYSVRVGRQSAYGGGVLGRFDGVSAGYGITRDFRINVVGGQLADLTIGEQPKFAGASLDFGAKSSFGGSLYFINQTVEGILDRQAIGGLMRYFAQGNSVFSLVDYDKQFNKLNMFTLQGSFSLNESTDYNFLVDHRRSPSLSIRNSVNGTSASVSTLLDQGFTIDDLMQLADLRTPISDVAQIGMTNKLNERWQMGTDISVSNTSALQESGTLNPDFTVGQEGFVPAQPSTGNAWNISERLMGTNVITSNDLTMFSVSLSTSEQVIVKQFLMHNHAMWNNKWTLDSTFRLSLQNDTNGGEAVTVSPTARVSYRMNNSISLESELGADWTRNRPNDTDSTVSIREYMALGFRWDF